MITNNISNTLQIRANYMQNKVTQHAKSQSFGAKIPSLQQATQGRKSFFSSIAKFLKLDDLINNFKSRQVDKLKKESEKALSSSDSTTVYGQSQGRMRKKLRLHTKKKERGWRTKGRAIVPSLDISIPGRNGTYISLYKYEKTELCPPEVRLTRYDSDSDTDWSVLENIVIRPNSISHMRSSNKDGHYNYSERDIPEGQQLEKWLNLAKKLFLASQKNKPS